MKIIITGASGFLGSQLVSKLENTKHKLILIDSVQPKVKTNHLFVKANLLNVIEYQKYFKKTDIVFHFAAISDIEYSKKNSTKTLETNILSTKYLLV